MQSKRPDEFHINIRWKPGYHGGKLPEGVPGFYVSAGWSNEGEAFYPIDDLRTPPGLIQGVCTLLDKSFCMDGGFENTGAVLKSAHNAAATTHAASLKKRVEALRRQLAEAEAAVSDIEHLA